MDKNFYNEASAKKLGWAPNWFGEKYFDDKLLRAVKKWQKARHITADGLCGPMRKIRYFVNHWDVCLSSNSCQNVLDKRGISVHFLIDNDGTIYQTLDLQHAAWHAGSSRTNRPSVGVEITNAYYTKYQDWYIKNGFGPRPVIKDAWVHASKLEPFLGFYPVQIEALKALWKSIHESVEIPYDTPANQFGKTSTKYEQKVAYGKFSGFVSHYHVSKSKIDCAGLDIRTFLDEVKYGIDILDGVKAEE